MKKLTSIIFILLSLLFIKTSLAANAVRSTPTSGTVALTFDDGPSPIYTPKILKILADNHIKATFFVVGNNAKRHPELIKAIQEQGHAIALHTMSHPKLPRLNQKQLYYEIVHEKHLIADMLKKQPTCLRPPYGLSNERVVALAKKHGIIVVPIGFNSFDYNRPGVNKLINWVVSHAHAGMVVLLHDGYKNKQQTVDALPKIIAGIRKRGLGFSAICYPQ